MRNLFIVTLLVLGASSPVKAFLYTVGFDGTIDYTFHIADHPIWGDEKSVPAGTSFRGYYTIDLDAPFETFIGNPNTSYQSAKYSLVDLRVSVGEIAYHMQPIGFYNAIVEVGSILEYAERISAHAYGKIFQCGYDYDFSGKIIVDLQTDTHGLLSGAALPSEFPAINQWEKRRMFQIKSDLSGPSFFSGIVGTVENVYEIPQPIPEPSTVALFGIGIAGFVARRRISKRR